MLFQLTLLLPLVAQSFCTPLGLRSSGAGIDDSKLVARQDDQPTLVNCMMVCLRCADLTPVNCLNLCRNANNRIESVDQVCQVTARGQEYNHLKRQDDEGNEVTDEPDMTDEDIDDISAEDCVAKCASECQFLEADDCQYFCNQSPVRQKMFKVCTDLSEPLEPDENEDPVPIEAEDE